MLVYGAIVKDSPRFHHMIPCQPPRLNRDREYAKEQTATGLSPGPGTLRRPGRGHRPSPARPRAVSPSPCTAGRATMWAGSSGGARNSRRARRHRQLPGQSEDTDELRLDLSKASPISGGRHRLNLHASTASAAGGRSTATRSSRNTSGLDRWAKRRASAWTSTRPIFASESRELFTLSHPDKGIRQFWIEHGKACRKIGAAHGQGAGHALRHQRLDSGRLQRHPRGPARPRGAGSRVPRSRLRRRS